MAPHENGATVANLPKRFQRIITHVDAGDGWHGLTPDDAETIENIAWKVSCLWHLVGESQLSLDCPEFFGEEATYQVIDTSGDAAPVRIEPGPHGDARIAVANWRYADSQWAQLLTKSCWDSVNTYPPAIVLGAMFQEHFGFAYVDAQYAQMESDDMKVIKLLENRRIAGVAVLRSVVAMFHASLIVSGVKRVEPGKLSRGRDPSNWAWVFSHLRNPLSWKQITRLIDSGSLVAQRVPKRRAVAFELAGLLRHLPTYNDDIPFTTKPPKRR